MATGCVEREDYGLTDRGREVIEELNRLGILIGISHCGYKTSMDIIEATQGPIAVTHTTPATLVEIRRAQKDEILKAVAEKGGIIGQVVIRTSFCEKRDRMGTRATLSDFVDIVDYLVSLVGVDHVGFRLDLTPLWTREDYYLFGGSQTSRLLYPHKRPPFEEQYVEGFDGIANMINITEELVTREYFDADTNKSWGG